MHSMITVIGRSCFGVNSGFSLCLERVLSSSISDLDDLGDAAKEVVLLAEGGRERIEIVFKWGDNPRFVVEMKESSAFRANSLWRAPSLVQEYTNWSLAAFKDLDESRANPAVCAVEQLYSCLHKLDLKFGVLSSLDLTYLVQRQNTKLSISDPIEWNNGKLVAALGFIIHSLVAHAHAHVESASGLDSMEDGHHGDTQMTLATSNHPMRLR
jgi:hypothetical protein